MIMKNNMAIIVVLVVIVGGSLLSGCTQLQQPENKFPFESGTLRLMIKDKPGPYILQHVNITISQVQVHMASHYNETMNTSTQGGSFNVSTNGPYAATIGETILFIGNASDGIEPYNWSWDFGDGNTSSLQDPQHSYSAQGIYLVNLTVRDDSNATAWEQTTAIIDQETEVNQSGWITIVNETQTFDLLALQNTSALLGEKNLTVGKYTQIRLTVTSGIITINVNGSIEEHTLKVPSDSIKLIHPFTITENTTTVLTLDFLVNQSIHQTGNGKFLLKPTIKIIQE
jgi:PKD repeat protein